ncbi:hypothetical protein [Azospirillum sp. sgz301742]
MTYTTTDFVASITSRGLFPKSQQTFSDGDILRFANEELINDVIPLIVKFNEEYFTREIAIPFEEGKVRYRIPPRAMGQKLRDVYWTDSEGNPQPLSKVNREEAYTFPTEASRPLGYYLEGNDIRLVPYRLARPQGSLVVVINMRPSRLVPANRARKVVAVTDSTITINGVPAHFLTGQRIDVVSQYDGGEVKQFDLQIAGITAQTLVFNACSITDVEVGDWIVLADETPVLQTPAELYPYLLELTSIRILQALGNAQAVQTKMAALPTMRSSLANVIENRVQGDPTKIVNRNNLLRIGTRRRI